MDIVSIKAQPRETTGKSANRRARKAGLIPCVIYGGKELINFSTSNLALKPLVYTPEFKLAEIDINGKTYKSILKDIQFSPTTDEIVHADFQELIDGQKVKVEVPLRFEGVSAGVKAGGKLSAKLRRIKIKSTPEHLVNELRVSITDVELGSSVRVKDIVRVEGIEILNSPNIPVASVEIPRALKSATASAEEGKEGAAPDAQDAPEE